MEINKDFLTNFIGSKVTNYEISKIYTNGLLSEIYLINVEIKNKKNNLKLLLKLKSDKKNYNNLSYNELKFYKSSLSNQLIKELPKIYYLSDLNDTIIMQFLGKKYNQYNLLDSKLNYNYIKKCLQAIGSINGKYFGNVELLNYNWLCKNQKYEYYNPQYIIALNQCNKDRWENYYIMYLKDIKWYNKYNKVKIGINKDELGNLWGENAQEILNKIKEKLKNKPFTLLHGDFHNENIFFRNENNIFKIIDWQFVHLGPPGEDLYQFLPGCINTNILKNDQTIITLLKNYYKSFESNIPEKINIKYSFKDLLEDWKCSLIIWWFCLPKYSLIPKNVLLEKHISNILSFIFLDEIDLPKFITNI